MGVDIYTPAELFDTMLGNTKKPDLKRPDLMGVGFTVDLSQLEVSFGGFSPTALGDGFAPLESVEASSRRMAEHKKMREQAAAIEAARASEERTWEDESGTVWHYVVLDGETVRIESFEPAVEEIVAPSEIEGKPVVATGPDSFAYHKTITSIELPESIVSIGFSSFRGCPQLKRAVLPIHVDEFNSNWFNQCRKLEHLVMPGMLEKIKPNIFDIPNLKELVVGPGTESIEPGAFAKSKLESIQIHPDNPYLMTDGKAIYSKDGAVMVALVIPVDSYVVLPQCKAISKKGFSNFECVKTVTLPDTFEALSPFAMSRTGITEFVAPSSLSFIGEKAFYMCSKLKSVTLGNSVTTVCDHAFSDTKLEALRLPSSIKQLGNPLAQGVPLEYAGADATFSIEPGGFLTLDEWGALYCETEMGKVLIRMMNPSIQSYQVMPGTVVVGEYAFEAHASIRQVTFPEGLLAIQRGAFKGCSKLESVSLPESLEKLGDEAFLDTVLTSLHIPARLADIGALAILSRGSYHALAETPTLKSITIDEGNPRYFMHDGMFMERVSADNSRVLLCTGAEPIVHVPEDVTTIAAYAFNSVGGLQELYLSDRITEVGVRGLALDGPIELIHIDLVEPINGHDALDIRFPHTDRGCQQMMLALSISTFVNVSALYEAYDNSVVNASSFDAASTSGLDQYDQVTRIVDRLQDPVCLPDTMRDQYGRVIRASIVDYCMAIARKDDRATMDSLFEFGFLTEDNLMDVIDRVGALQDASMTNYLLEQKRLRFGMAAIDFDL